MIQERVSPGQQEAIRLRFVEIEYELAGLHPIDSQSPALNHALLTQPRECPESAGSAFLEAGEPFIAVKVLRYIVHPHKIEVAQPHAFETSLDRAQGAVSRIVVHDAVGAAVLKQTALLPEI